MLLLIFGGIIGFVFGVFFFVILMMLINVFSMGCDWLIVIFILVVILVVVILGLVGIMFGFFLVLCVVLFDLIDVFCYEWEKFSIFFLCVYDLVYELLLLIVCGLFLCWVCIDSWCVELSIVCWNFWIGCLELYYFW